MAADKPRAEVMLFGVFHFANPGLDVIKTDQIDVTTEDNQAYLVALAGRLAEFDPTVVLLEFAPERQEKVQQEFKDFRNSQFQLPANEIYQIGFRVAAMSAAQTIHSFDETTIGWQGQSLFDYLQSDDAETGGRLNALIKDITEEEQHAQRTMTLQQLLMRTNDPQRDRLNRSFYLLTNHVGDSDSFVGADATASWWHRNFRMYAHIQRFAQPGERVLVIGGQGHTAILKQLLADDPERIAVDVAQYL